MLKEQEKKNLPYLASYLPINQILILPAFIIIIIIFLKNIQPQHEAVPEMFWNFLSSIHCHHPEIL